MRISTLVRISFLLMTIFASIGAEATTYYIDAATTLSTQNGSFANPWKTLSQVSSNQSSFQPGDFVLFKRGGVYSGTFYPTRGGNASAPLTFGAYGTGAKPKFTGTGARIGYLFYVQDKSYIIFRDLWITDPSIDNSDRSIDAKIQRAFTFDQSATNCKIISCDIQLVGVAGYWVGGSHTMDSCDVGNLRMVVDTDQGYQPGNDDDYGANPLVISSANNTITHNNFHDCWATSFDYGYDGGAIEFYGSGVNNNFIAYNVFYDCIGITEANGSCDNNTFAYNKIINNGSLFYFQSGYSYTNWKVLNNVFIENAPSRVPESRLIGGSLSANSITMKNNIFQMSNGIDIAGNANAIVHEDNIYKMSNNSVIGYTINSTELSTSAAIFVSTSNSNPTLWNYALATASPAIDFGHYVGLAKDFAGNTVPTIPNSGILETAGGGTALTASSSGGAISCNGGSTTITVSANGGSAPYTGTGSFTVSAGNYTYTVTDANGATASTSISVSQPAVIAVSIVAGTIPAFGGTTGVTVAASGGTGAFTYKLNSGSYQSTNNFTGVAAGSHSVTVKDANGCTSVKSFTLTQPAPAQLLATSSATQISCNGGTATVTVSASGGVAPYTGTGTFTRSAGPVTFTVTDALGTTAQTNLNITQPSGVAVSFTAGTIAVYGGTTSVTLNASGGTGSFTYRKNTGSYQSSNVFTGLIAGTYTFTAKDANTCTETVSVTLTQPNPPAQLIASASAPAILCNGGSTSVLVSATGGVAPYTGTGTFNVNAGTYNYTVTDANGTTASTSVTITQPAAISATIAAGTIGVYGGTTAVTANASGGVAPYSYKLNAGTFQASNNFTGVAAGSHTITVQDVNGCSMPKSFTLTQPAAPATLTAGSSATAISCNGATAIVTVSATGGTAPYTGTGVFTVVAGSYSYTVTDANGQAATTAITVTQPTEISISVVTGTINVYGGTTSVTVNATGGSGSYSYQIDNGSYQSSNVFNGVTAGNHTIAVKDANGCINYAEITITQPAINTLVASGTFTQVLCSGTISTITVTASGGTAPYTGTGLFTGFAGTYTYTVTDATGATAIATVTVTQPAAIQATVVAGTIQRTGETTSVTVNATGGTGTKTYKLNNGSYQSGNQFTAVSAGTHTVTIRDANNCTITKTVVIADPATTTFRLNLASRTNVSCRGGNDGSIQAVATGGRAPYTYQLNSGTYGSNNIFRNLRAGVYRVNAKDADGRTAYIIVFVFDGSRRCSNSASGGRINVNAYPNPTTDRFNITVGSESTSDVMVEVSNLSGTVLYKASGPARQNYSFGHQFAPGTYVVKVIQDGTVTTSRVVKF